jgi:hypothetical protein
MKETWIEYASAWSTEDDEARNNILQKRLAAGVVYTDPQTQLSGPEKLSEYMRQFQRGFPGRRFVIEEVISHHGSCLAHWRLQNERNEVEMKGASFAEVDRDGRLSRIFGFFGAAAQ